MTNRNNLDKSEVLRRKISDLPTQPGVYLYRDQEGQLLYIGKAKVLRNRVKSYFHTKNLDAKTRRLVARIWDMEFIVCANELEALILENNLIKEHMPHFNILLRDDKNYPYVKLTWKDDYPKVYVTRRVVKDGSLYFGPFFPASSAYKSAELAQRFFQLRDCDLDLSKPRPRACLKYQLHRCTGPCIRAVSQDQYREQCKEARLFLEGKREELKARLEGAMWKASKAQAFEQAVQYRDALQQLDAWFTRQKVANTDADDTDILGSALLDGKACVHRLMLRSGRMVGRQEHILDEVESLDGSFLGQIIERIYQKESVPLRLIVEQSPDDIELLQEWLSSLRGAKVEIRVPQRGDKMDLLSMAQENARLALERKFEPAKLNAAVLEGLQAFLGLSHLPRRIECFDISHGQGREVVASCVVFQDGHPDKSNYRRFKLQNEQNNDFANMQEVVQRRYGRLKTEEKDMPELVLIDGGLGQLHVVQEALQSIDMQDLEMASLAKKEEWVYRPGANEPIRIPKSSPVLQLLQRIRDEAHRFAITYHRALRAKRTLQTELLEIPGVGKQSAQKLLKQFKSVVQVKEASLESLEDVVGHALAQKIEAWRNTQ